MRFTASYNSASEALCELSHYFSSEDAIRSVGGTAVSRRNGEIREILFPAFTIRRPRHRYIVSNTRKASLPAQIAETMWILSGRNDIGWLSHYLPRAAQFSDDGETWRGGYGPRLRDFGDEVDQLAHVVQLLKDDENTRRAVISIYDPMIDSASGEDIPCNNWLHFIKNPLTGALDMHVVARSNDLIWGWSGINQFEWSVLLELICQLTGLRMGAAHYSISSLHVYERHFGKCEDISTESPQLPQGESVWMVLKEKSLLYFDGLVEEWFELEGRIRRILELEYEDLMRLSSDIIQFPEPLLREWLIVLYYWNRANLAQSSDSYYSLKDSAMREALAASPKRKAPAPKLAGEPWYQSLLPSEDEEFLTFMNGLHAEKHAVYGDSWKKRGEQISILANIARKVDRLGVAGAGDTAADTAIDLFIYLAKYRVWLRAEEDTPENVNGEMRYLAHSGIRGDIGSDKQVAEEVELFFEDLSDHVVGGSENPGGDLTRLSLARSMSDRAYRLGRDLWLKERQWKADNEKRAWKGYDQ